MKTSLFAVLVAAVLLLAVAPFALSFVTPNPEPYYATSAALHYEQIAHRLTMQQIPWPDCLPCCPCGCSQNTNVCNGCSTSKNPQVRQTADARQFKRGATCPLNSTKKMASAMPADCPMLKQGATAMKDCNMPCCKKKAQS